MGFTQAMWNYIAIAIDLHRQVEHSAASGTEITNYICISHRLSTSRRKPFTFAHCTYFGDIMYVSRLLLVVLIVTASLVNAMPARRSSRAKFCEIDGE